MDEQSIPIDIHYNKLLDWLIDRRHCDQRWHQYLRQIREKIKHSLKDLPGGVAKLDNIKTKEIVDLTYFDCQNVMKYLLTVESTDTNIFGQYSSQRLKDWKDIINSYEKKNIYLAEGAQVLTRHVNYDIASLKRQVAQCQQQHREFSRKAKDCQDHAATHKQRFTEQCIELCIEGKDVDIELSHLVDDLPNIFEEVISLVSSISPSIQYYKAFRQSINNRSAPDDNILPLLSYLCCHGNTTVHEWKYGEPPKEKKELRPNEYSITSDPVENGDTIDWGDIEREGEIDFDEGEIDFDVGLDEVDLSLITIEGGGEEANRTTNIVMPRKSSFPTILEDFESRNEVLNDIMELLEFLKQREVELTSEGSGVLQVSTHLAETLQVHSGDDLVKMIDSVKKVIDKLTDKRTQHLLLILDSESYLHRLSFQLSRQNQLSQYYSRRIDEYIHKAEEAGSQQHTLELQLVEIVKTTKDLQKQVAAEISRRYKNRPVNIIGELNQL